MSLLLSPVPRDLAAESTGPGWGQLSWGIRISAACLPAAISYLAAVAVFAALTAAGGAESSVAAAARVGAMGWLAAHHVPLTIDGASLGVLPLLLTVLLGALVARGAARMAARCGLDQPADAGWVVGAIASTHGVLGAVLALVAIPVTVTADPALAAVACALVAGAAAVVGLVRPCGLLPVALRQAPDWVRPGVDAGLWGLAVLLATGLGTVFIALVVSAFEVVELSGPDAGSVLGLIVLSLGYLPNAAIAGLSWLAGPGFSIGALSISPFAVHAGPVPAVPLLAALPQGPAQPWWGVSLVVPLLVGAAVGRRCAITTSDRAQRLRILAVAATVMALGSAVLGALAGGRLGAAAFDPVEVPFGTLMLAVLAATLLGGSAATLLSPPAARSAPNTPTEPATPGDADADHDAASPTDRDHEAEAAGIPNSSQH
ncbi:MAG: cell division protein PerM [Pseudonocardiaceae bacterium]